MVVRIGHVTPSSNTVLEPLTYAMNAGLQGLASHHFSRVRVKTVSLDPAIDAQFGLERMLEGARLLADAPVDALVWNGTSASWRGLENDLAFCKSLSDETGLPVSTTTLAFYRAFRENGWTRIGLALPYTRDVSVRLVEEYTRQGLTVTGAPDLGISDNIAIGAVAPEAMRALLRKAAEGRPDCIAVVCTNLAAAPLVEEMEAELGLPIVDSVAVTFQEALRLAGIDRPIEGWGRLLRGG